MKTESIQLTADELKTLEGLEALSARIDKHLAQTRPTSVSESTRSARDAYVSSPTDTNLDNYLAALRSEAHIALSTHTNANQIPTAVEMARQALVDNKLRPFARSVIERALSAARKNFESVKKTEIPKIESATGHRYDEAIRSKAIDEARTVVQELEALLNSIAARPSFFATLREKFSA